MELDKRLKKSIRVVNDYPKKGVKFYDLNTVISSPLFKELVDAITYKVRVLVSESDITRDYSQVKIAGIEARGFIWASAIATQLKSSVIPIRKLGKIPDSTVSNYTHIKSEYSDEGYVLPKGCVKKGDCVILVDDVLATGQTALGAINLLSWAGAKIIGACFVLRLAKLKGEKSFDSIPHSEILSI